MAGRPNANQPRNVICRPVSIESRSKTGYLFAGSIARLGPGEAKEHSRPRYRQGPERRGGDRHTTLAP